MSRRSAETIPATHLSVLSFCSRSLRRRYYPFINIYITSKRFNSETLAFSRDNRLWTTLSEVLRKLEQDFKLPSAFVNASGPQIGFSSASVKANGN